MCRDKSCIPRTLTLSDGLPEIYLRDLIPEADLAMRPEQIKDPYFDLIISRHNGRDSPWTFQLGGIDFDFHCLELVNFLLLTVICHFSTQEISAFLANSYLELVQNTWLFVEYCLEKGRREHDYLQPFMNPYEHLLLRLRRSRNHLLFGNFDIVLEKLNHTRQLAILLAKHLNLDPETAVAVNRHLQHKRTSTRISSDGLLDFAIKLPGPTGNLPARCGELVYNLQAILRPLRFGARTHHPQDICAETFDGIFLRVVGADSAPLSTYETTPYPSFKSIVARVTQNVVVDSPTTSSMRNPEDDDMDGLVNEILLAAAEDINDELSDDGTSDGQDGQRDDDTDEEIDAYESDLGDPDVYARPWRDGFLEAIGRVSLLREQAIRENRLAELQVQQRQSLEEVIAILGRMEQTQIR